MRIVLACCLLGLSTCVFASASKVASGVVVWVWPPGAHFYLGESVVLRCNVSTAAAVAADTRPPQRGRWSYRWFRHRLHGAPPSLDPRRHLASGDTYTITGATAEDGGSYWCQAEAPGPGVNGSIVLLLSERVHLTVSGILPSLLSLIPNSLQFFRGDNLTVQCPGSVNNRTAWRLRQLSQDFGVRTWDLHAGLCSPLGGSVSAETPNACRFTGLSSGNSGLYWCESDTWRSNAVTVTVITNDTILLKSPYLVSEGDRVVLLCQFWNGNQRMATFFKDGQEVATQSSAYSGVGMALENVSKAQEGFYKCASQDRTIESPESWLSVKCNSTWTDWTEDSTHGTGTWIMISSAVVVTVFFLFTVLIVCLVYHRGGKQSMQACCWPSSKVEPASKEVPKTKQDATDVQWDLSWMELSHLLDKP